MLFPSLLECEKYTAWWEYKQIKQFFSEETVYQCPMKQESMCVKDTGMASQCLTYLTLKCLKGNA